MEKPLDHYLQIRSSYYQAAHGNQNTTIPVSTSWQLRSDKANKGEVYTQITITTSIHLLSQSQLI